ncbi:hypothetical protein IQ227_13575, partial [Anabaena aphanizomenioides LEGE 00250]
MAWNQHNLQLYTNKTQINQHLSIITAVIRGNRELGIGKTPTQSPVTCHLSPVPSHLSPVTSHQSPVTSPQSPVPSHQSPV